MIRGLSRFHSSHLCAFVAAWISISPFFPATAESNEQSRYCVSEEKVGNLLGQTIFKLNQTEHNACLDQQQWVALQTRLSEYVAVVETNARSVNRWMQATSIARQAELSVQPLTCAHDHSGVFMDCAFDSLGSAFSNFTNALDIPGGSGTAGPTILFINHIFGEGQACEIGSAKVGVVLTSEGAKLQKSSHTNLHGTIIVSIDLYQSVSLPAQVQYSVGYCGALNFFHQVADGSFF